MSYQHRGIMARHAEPLRRRRRLNRRNRTGFSPLAEVLEIRALLAVTIVDISVLEGNAGPQTISNTLDPGSETQLYQFTGTAGQKLFFDNLTASSTSGNWQLFGPSNQYVAGANISNDFGATLPYNGTYVLALQGVGNLSNTLDYSFRIFDVTEPTVSLSGLGGVHSGSLAAGGLDTFTFDAPAGQFLYLDSQDRDFDGSSIQILDPSGSSIYNNNASYDSGVLRLMQSGTYTVAVSSSSAADYQFRLLALPNDTSTLTLNSEASDSLSPNEARIYRFDGASGQRLYYDALSTSNQGVNVSLVNPNGQIVSVNQNANSDTDLFTLTDSGTYYLLLDSTASTTAGYDFRLLDTSPSYTLGATQSGTLNPGTSTDLYHFSGTEGQRVFVNITASNPDYVGYWRLYSPTNQQLIGNYVVENGYAEVVLPTDGPYVLAFQGSRTDGTVDYTFTVSTPAETTDGPDPGPGGQRHHRGAGRAGRLHLQRKRRSAALLRRSDQRRQHLGLPLRAGWLQRLCLRLQREQRHGPVHADAGGHLPAGHRR